MELTEEEKSIVYGIFEWVKRMSLENGDIVVDRNQIKYDWGQALCRERFGTDWYNYMKNNNIIMPDQKDFNRAIEWENGNIPDWVLRYENEKET